MIRPVTLGAAFLASVIPFVSGQEASQKKPEVGINKTETKPVENNIENAPPVYDEGMKNLFFYFADKGKRDTHIPNSSRQIGKKTLVLDRDEKYVKATLIKNGVKAEELESKLKQIREKTEEFNSLVVTNKVLTINMGYGSTEQIKERLLKPKVSPSETVSKYDLAKYGFPIVIDVGNQRVDIDSIAKRRYLDPKDGKVKKGTHIRNFYNDWTEDSKKSEEDRTFLLVPDYVPVALKTKYGVLVVVSHGYFRVIR